MFKAFVANKPFVASRCYRQVLSSTGAHAHRFPPTLSFQRRHIFGFPTIRQPTETKARKQINEADGSRPMIQLTQALNHKSRPPTLFELAEGFMVFVDKRLGEGARLTRHQARFLLDTFKYIESNHRPLKDSKDPVHELLELENLEFTLNALATAKLSPDASAIVTKLARRIFLKIQLQLENQLGPDKQPSIDAFRSYISILSASSTSQALRFTRAYFQINPNLRSVLSPWVNIMKACEDQGYQSRFPAVIKNMEDCGIILDTTIQERISVPLAKENSIKALEFMAGLPIERSTTTNICLLKSALWNSMIPWATQIATYLPSQPTPETRDALLLLSAAQGDSIDSISQQLDTMAAKNPEIRSTMTIDTVNTLIEYANTINRTDMAEQGTQIAQKWGLSPDPRTFLLQMHSRIAAADINDAVVLFQKLDSEYEIDASDAPVLNNLITQLCRVENSSVDFDTVNFLVQRLLEADGRFDPTTLSTLCKVLLYHGDLEGVSSLLRPIIDGYDFTELVQIRQPFIDYIKDMDQPTDSVWEAYELLKLAFQTTPVSARTEIMMVFFKRQRSDLACLVFGHMRQRGDFDGRPTEDTYAQCFQGITETADPDGLHLVHNMLKLDLEVLPTTKIRNSLMLAYASCDIADQAMGVFREILHSEEGPSEQTLVIFFRVCESYHNGLEEANKMMQKLKSLDILINEDVYNAYVGALGGGCALELAVEAIKAMESQIGSPPTAFTLATLYNSIPHQYWKDQAEEWAKVIYPELWRSLEEVGRTKDENGLQHLNIDRSIQL
ncbi:hypothetical protein FQN49_003330 [Arthroderma sp. PD_2]|nr:hypothetical protein FQN49_003330 [Arthroderma sp. PD_2]